MQYGDPSAEVAIPVQGEQPIPVLQPVRQPVSRGGKAVAAVAVLLVSIVMLPLLFFAGLYVIGLFATARW
jgi:hypothetical protein